MIDFLYINLSIPSKTLPNIEKAQSEFGRRIEKKRKNYFPREPKRTKNNNRIPNAAITATWTASELDHWRNELTSDFRLLTNILTNAPTHITLPR